MRPGCLGLARLEGEEMPVDVFRRIVMGWRLEDEAPVLSYERFESAHRVGGR